MSSNRPHILAENCWKKSQASSVLVEKYLSKTKQKIGVRTSGFNFCFGFGATLGGSQGLLLALKPGFIPGGPRGPYEVPEI